MINNHYEKYKNTNIDWIGKIPVDWKLEKLKHILTERNIKNNPVKTNEILSLTAKQGVIPLSEKEHVGGNKPKDDLTQYKLAFPNDIVLNSMNIISGAVGLSKHYGCVSPVYYMFFSDDNKINIEYYNYIFQIKSFQRMLLKFGKGILIRKSKSGKLNTIRMKIPMESFKELELPVLDIETQNSIVNFLNYNVSNIDNQISKFDELINLLEEKRNSIINQVVTKSLNPNNLMKDSGVEWIGEIPATWDIINLKKCCETITDGSHFSPETTNEGKYYITVRNVGEDSIDFNNAPKISIEDYNALKNNGCEPKEGDVLLSKDGTIGKCIIVNRSDFVILSSLGLLRPNKLIKPEYLRYFLLSDINMKQMYSHIRGSAIKRLTISIIKELLLILPPLNEQEEIINYLNPEVNKINMAINKIKKNIDLLEEYKTSLIHHVVTGKIDVRSE